jgi:hypothetical protein
MANAITTHTIMNGTRNLILQYNLVADGTGDEANTKIFTLTDYTGEDQKEPNNFKVKKLTSSGGIGTSIELLFGSTSENNRLFYQSPADANSAEMEWPGGMTTLVADTDGTIRLNTNGFGTADDQIQFTLWIQKKHQNAQS